MSTKGLGRIVRGNRAEDPTATNLEGVTETPEVRATVGDLGARKYAGGAAFQQSPVSDHKLRQS